MIAIPEGGTGSLLLRITSAGVATSNTLAAPGAAIFGLEIDLPLLVEQSIQVGPQLQL